MPLALQGGVAHEITHTHMRLPNKQARGHLWAAPTPSMFCRDSGRLTTRGKLRQKKKQPPLQKGKGKDTGTGQDTDKGKEGELLDEAPGPGACHLHVLTLAPFG